MQHILRDFHLVKDLLEQKYILLFLDYDGTLAPITKTPEETIFPPENRSILEQLTKLSTCQLVVISGRALVDVRNRVGLENIIYVGNHGFEIDSLGNYFESPLSYETKQIFGQIKRNFEKDFSEIPGIILEDKRWSISVHYRLVDEHNLPLFSSVFSEVCRPYLVSQQITVYTGKKVFEIRPATKWDKGRAVLWVLLRQQFLIGDRNILPVYIGDDQTDEDAFQSLKKQGITILVGEDKISDAKYFLADTQEVSQFLMKILELKCPALPNEKL